MARRTYIEKFENGPAGWLGWDRTGATRLEIQDGVAVSRSPWWVDYNHAPPGGGYLHILFCLMTASAGANRPEVRAVAEENRYVAQGFCADMTDARLTLCLKGTVTRRQEVLVLLVQGKVEGKMINSVLSAQPLEITPEFTEQTVHLVPDEGQWTCLGSRHDRTATYDAAPIAPLLRNVDADIILVLWPLEIVPATPLPPEDVHRLRAGRDYELDPAFLPDGVVMLEEVRLAFPG